MDTSAILFAATLTLALPGPTNALLAVAGTTAGFRRAAPLALAAVFGYGLAVMVMVTVALPLAVSMPLVGRVLRLVAAGILIHVALGLWTAGGFQLCKADGSRKVVSWRAVFGTTLLNPKSVVLAMLVMPAGDALAPAPGVMMLMLAGLVAGSALGWIGIGAVVGARAGGALATGFVQRGGAVILSGFAAMMTVLAFQ